MNAELADDVAHVRRARHPGRRLPASIGRCCTATSASRASPGTRTGSRIPTRCCSRSRRRGYHLMTWSGMWACGSDARRQRARGAGARLPGAGLQRAAELRRRRRHELHPRRHQPGAQAWWRDKVARLRRAHGISTASSSTAARSTSRPRPPTSGPTAARVARCATTTRRCRRRSTTTRSRSVSATTSCSSRGPAYTGTQHWSVVLGRRHPRQHDTSAAARAPTSACAARSSASSARRSWASRSGAPTPAATTSSRTARSSRAGSSSARSPGFMEIGGHGTHAPWDMPTDARVRRRR